MAAAAKAAGVTTLVGFNYLKNPTHDLARRLIADGDRRDQGLSRHLRPGRADGPRGTVQLAHGPRRGRLRRALGDMGSHVLSLALMLAGDIVEVCGMADTYVHERVLAASGSGNGARAGAPTQRREVENEDVAQFMAVFANGALWHFVANRLGTGRKLGLTYEVPGTEGALCYEQERMNELQFYRRDGPRFERGHKLIYSGPDHGAYGAFFPIAGVGLGYDDQKTIEVRALIEAVAAGRKAEPDFRFGCRVSRVIDAALRSAAERRWVAVGEIA